MGSLCAKDQRRCTRKLSPGSSGAHTFFLSMDGQCLTLPVPRVACECPSLSCQSLKRWKGRKWWEEGMHWPFTSHGISWLGGGGSLTRVATCLCVVGRSNQCSVHHPLVPGGKGCSFPSSLHESVCSCPWDPQTTPATGLGVGDGGCCCAKNWNWQKLIEIYDPIFFLQVVSYREIPEFQNSYIRQIWSV